jgi:hypothetical protein
MLDERPDEFDERNLFFIGLLGLVSALGRLDAALAREAPGAAVPSDDPTLLCALGLVAFRRRLAAHLQRLDEPLREVAPPSPAPHLSLRTLLR